MSSKHDLKKAINNICMEHGVNPEKFPEMIESLYSLSVEYGKKQRTSGVKSFISLAETMRSKQKSFFNGDKTVLQEAKKAENKFDKAISYVKKYS